MADKRPHKSIWRRLLRFTLTVLTIISSLGLLAGAFGGDYNPASAKGLCLMVMTFPGWILAWLLLTIANALWYRKALIISIAAFIPSAKAIWEFIPLNVIGPIESRYSECPKFTLLSYNVLNYKAFDDVYPDGTNPTISFILKTDADIVCLQEAFIPGILVTVEIGDGQIDSLHRKYPYYLIIGDTQTFLSKYPIEALPTGYSKRQKYKFAAARVHIDGVPITIFNVHLQSYELRDDDKALYHDITSLNTGTDLKEDWLEVKSQLLSKLQIAAELRAQDADHLGALISRLGGPNVIVTGDFNDVPGCYTLRHLAEYGLKQVYPEVGFGPMITYHASRFYFRIDHTLYRGCLKPLRMKRPRVNYSDHYPIITTFALTGDCKDN